MLKLNTMLAQANIDPCRVQLVRHQDTRHRSRATPYTMWLNQRDQFEHYQRLQTRDVFDDKVLIASFVVPPNGETLFAGLYEVRGRATNTQTETCPLSGRQFSPGSVNVYDISSFDSELSGLAGLLTVDWGRGNRSWVQRAHKQNKQVIELRRQRQEPPFPTFAQFQTRTDELETLPDTWRAILSATGGVYLLVSLVNGEQYVGSASGDEGLLARWSAYARDGHGGNILLKQRGKGPFAVCVLETTASSATRTDVLRVEQEWKRKLGSRAFGLNAN